MASAASTEKIKIYLLLLSTKTKTQQTTTGRKVLLFPSSGFSSSVLYYLHKDNRFRILFEYL